MTSSPSAAASPRHRPRITVLISHLVLAHAPSRLALEVQRVLHEYAHLAEIRLVDRVFAQALDYALELERAQATDVLVCAGATGAYLRKHLGLPVVLMQTGGLELLQALERARRPGERVAVLSYREASREVEAIRNLISMEVRQDTYTTLEEAQARVAAFAREGFRVVIGSSMVTEIAEERGLTGILALSAEATRQALDDALAICRSARAESVKRQRLDAILKQLGDGVLALGLDGRVQSLNPAMARLLDVDPAAALGRPIDEVAPGCGLGAALSGHPEASDRVMKLKGRPVLVSVTPLVEDDEVSGAVLTARATADVQRADRRIRAQTRPGRFAARHVLNDMVAESAAMRRTLDLAERYAGTESTVLITGESGTGKELLAQGLHNRSRRRGRPFVAINCGAFPESLLESELFGYEEGAFTGSRRGGKPGLLEAAHTGTVFLDEIGDMPLSLQTRLLRVLQEREVLRLGGVEPTPIDVRVLAATHRDLRTEIAAGRFRQDLYYRIAILRVHLPALRERREDLAPLARQIARRLESRIGGGPSWQAVVTLLLPRLAAYPWPGNVRELESVLERALLMSQAASAEARSEAEYAAVLPELFDAPDTSQEAATSLHALGKATEIAHVRRIVDECGGDLKLAGKRLGVSRSTIWRRLNSGVSPVA